MQQSSCKSMKTALAVAAAVAAVGVAAEGVSYRQAADMLYLVMSSDRAVYARKVVQRLTRDEQIPQGIGAL